MADDLVKRLRSPEVFIDTGGMFSPVANEAADRIEAQDKRNKELEAALHTIVCNTEPEAWRHSTYEQLADSIFECARAALGEKKDG